MPKVPKVPEVPKVPKVSYVPMSVVVAVTRVPVIMRMNPLRVHAPVWKTATIATKPPGE